MNLAYGDDPRRMLIDNVTSAGSIELGDRLGQVKYHSTTAVDDYYMEQTFLGPSIKSKVFTRIPPLQGRQIKPSNYQSVDSAFVSGPASQQESPNTRLQDWLEELSYLNPWQRLRNFRLPRKYTVNSGLKINWQEKLLRRLRWLIPLLLIAIALFSWLLIN